MRIATWVLVLLVAPAAGAQTLRVETIGDRSALVVSAVGEVEVMPDRATLGINIQRDDAVGVHPPAVSADRARFI